jgi:maltoporin
MHRFTSISLLALGLALAAPPSRAADREGFHGYLRAGAGISDQRGPQTCFSLGGNTMSYRLGNECDSYAEFGYTKELARSDNGATFVGTVWASAWKPQSDFAGTSLELNKAYIEARNLDFTNGGAIWIGKRYYYLPDVLMLDLQYVNLNGVGGGIDGVRAGPGKFSYAVFKDDDRNDIDPNNGRPIRSQAALRQNVIYEGLPVNPGGTLDAVFTLISADRNPESHGGWQLSALHKQDKVFGGFNTVGIQYGVGPGTGVGGRCCGRIGGSGSTLLGADVRRRRLFDNLVIQPARHLSLELIALIQNDRSDAGGSSTWTTLGVRPAYAVTENFKLQMEAGTSRVSSPTGGAAMRLSKVTFAPTITVNQSYYARPELRAFITYAKWNRAAIAAVNASNNSGPVFGNDTSGMSAGLQAETWF